jgi:16S rRNA (guanine527-N7)-methyltransferase
MEAEEALTRAGKIDEAFAKIADEASAFGVTLKDDTAATLRRFAHRLLDANDTMDLTAITDPREVAVKHFLDSLTIIPRIPADAKTLADVGTGAGFPGLVIAIVRPDLRVALIESIAKKALFLEKIVDELDIPNVAVVCSRAEDTGRHPDMRDSFDVVVARAVAETATLAEYIIPLVSIGGFALMQKSDIALPEVRDGSNAITAVGATVRRIDSIDVSKLAVISPDAATTLTGRSIVVLEKTSPTPDTYPRRVGVPTKRPMK